METAVARTETSRVRPDRHRMVTGPNADIAAVFDGYPPRIRSRLKALRRLILDTARTTDGVGTIEEALRWGQPSYLTTETGNGSTIRIDRVKSTPDQYAIYFHCQTDLVGSFRERYPELTYSGNRSIVLAAGKPLPEAELRHCIALALTYHLNRRKARRK
jgi:hypothetical protein